MWRRILTFLVLVGLLAGGGWGWKRAVEPGRFPLQRVIFEGMTHTDPGLAREAMAIDDGTNILAVSLSTVQKRIKDLPWVKEVRVARVLPGALRVTVTEHEPLCLATVGGRLVLLDGQGEPIKYVAPGDPLLFPVVSIPEGGADQEGIVEMIAFLDRQPWLKRRVVQVEGLSNKRWVLHTRNGARLIFAGRLEQAAKRLAFMQKRFSILDRKVSRIDLTLADRVAVRMIREDAPPVGAKPVKG